MTANNVRIRRAAMPDVPYFYDICLKTGDAGQDASAFFYDPFLLGQYYAAPYLFYPEGLSFVAEQDYRPRGYIVAAPDTNAFNRWMEEKWLPLFRRQYPLPMPPSQIRSQDEGRLYQTFHSPHLPPDTGTQSWLADYPAHLHIDLLPEAQGRGLGRRLMETLCAELSRQAVPGIHLGVSQNNTRAIAFYQKTGFSVLHTGNQGMVMGKKL